MEADVEQGRVRAGLGMPKLILPLIVWGRRSRAKQRKVGIRVNVDLAALPGTPGFLDGPWVQVSGGKWRDGQ